MEEPHSVGSRVTYTNHSFLSKVQKIGTAKKEYLAFVKKRRASRQERRKVIKKQLEYIKRNLAHIEQLVQLGATLESLTKSQYKILLVVHEVYRQQILDFGFWIREEKGVR